MLNEPGVPVMFVRRGSLTPPECLTGGLLRVECVLEPKPPKRGRTTTDGNLRSAGQQGKETFGLALRRGRTPPRTAERPFIVILDMYFASAQRF